MRLGTVARKITLTLGLPTLLIALWWVTTAGSESFYFPPLSEILGVFAETWFTGRLMADVVPSLVRLLIGYGAALLLGVAIGIPVGSSRTLRAVVEPVLEFFRAIPPPVLVPIIILFAGIGDAMKVIVIVSGCVWPILLNTVEGVRGLDTVLTETARCYRMRLSSRLWRLVLPGASPQITAGARQALSIGIILMVISEMFAATDGIGFTIIQFQRSFAIPQMWSGIILLGLIGVGLALLFRVAEHYALGWYRGMRQSQRGEML